MAGRTIKRADLTIGLMLHRPLARVPELAQCWPISCGSIDVRAGELHHLGPFRGIGRDSSAIVLR